MKYPKIEEIHSRFLLCDNVHIDSRQIGQGDAFFALRGTRSDGHLYVANAKSAGARLVVIDDAKYYDEEVSVLVDDVEKTLQDLARYHRMTLGIPFVGLTGSNGKTTTKELIYAVLSQKYNVYATHGNLNNHLGVPLSVLSVQAEHEVAVIEMGANHQGEIAFLSSIAMPDYGLITNIGKAHLEGFGGIEGVRRGKTELYRYIQSTHGEIFVNDDDERLVQSLPSGVVTHHYSVRGVDVGVRDKSLILNVDGVEINSQLTGRYNAVNIIAAIAVGSRFGIPLDAAAQGIAGYKPNANRSQIKDTARNTLVLDAYNANPSSMLASLDNLAEIEADRKIAIIGHMLELGDDAQVEHQKVADYAAKLRLDAIYFVGSEWNEVDTNDYPKHRDIDTLVASIVGSNLSGATILLKGSRGIALERLVDYL